MHELLKIFREPSTFTSNIYLAASFYAIFKQAPRTGVADTFTTAFLDTRGFQLSTSVFKVKSKILSEFYLPDTTSNIF